MDKELVQLLVIGVVGAFLLWLRSRKQHLGRRGQLVLLLVALAFSFYQLGPLAGFGGIAAMLILIYYMQGTLRMPVAHPAMPLKATPDFSEWEGYGELNRFLEERGFAFFTARREKIAEKAYVELAMFQQEHRTFIQVQRQDFQGKSSYESFFLSFLDDGRSVMSTRSFSNFDSPFPERHPIHQFAVERLEDLLGRHKEKVEHAAKTSAVTTLADPDQLWEQLDQRDEEKKQHALEKGWIVQEGDAYVYTPRGRLTSITRFFDFTSLLKSESVS